ncbi:MAG: hypothetical protein LBS12_07695 [Prevotellaceae bacterium]|jgi:hypothetical protein|nr:hypothetical protein [Prevotellaceae bacterium]
MLSFSYNARVWGLVFLLGLSAAGLQAQTNEQRREMDMVKNSKDYYWGEGAGETGAVAEKEALSSLIGRISTHVRSIFGVHVTDSTGSDVKRAVTSMVVTCSNATLHHTEKLTWGDEPEVRAFCYVKRSDVEKVFTEREATIKEYVKIARAAEADYQIADALRYYYWALMLLTSHPDAGSMTMNFEDETKRLNVYLRRQIETILGNLKIEVTGKQPDRDLTLYLFRISYNSHPVSNCGYTFFNGRNDSRVIDAKDGLGYAEIPGNPELHTGFRVNIEYAYMPDVDDNSAINWNNQNDVKEVLWTMNRVAFKNTIEVPLAFDEAPPTPPAAVAELHTDTLVNAPASAASATVRLADGAPYLPLLGEVEKAIRTRNYASARHCFTDEGYEMFTRLVQYGRGVILTPPDYTFMAFEGTVLARALPMKFSFADRVLKNGRWVEGSRRREFVEKIVFHISPADNKIQALSFALSDAICRDVMKAENNWNDYSRVALIHFIENYQTAYALERVDFLESIFSDNALIIVGRIVKKLDTDNRFITEAVELTTKSKTEYMDHLRMVFSANEYVNLKFANISVVKAYPQEEWYGIQLRQDYYSTHYGDTGYLFLLVDLNDPEKPVIYVRTWQPKPDPNIKSSIGIDGVYNPKNFF